MIERVIKPINDTNCAPAENTQMGFIELTSAHDILHTHTRKQLNEENCEIINLFPKHRLWQCFENALLS